ncbi:MAG: DHH family phosphoesterase [Oscillospiraceae bacterium]|jgi:c-di-AMP phosphodiesterase-like protein|nr:DHH family phosphoesterase [Oscillospiraceae bacterium]
MNNNLKRLLEPGTRLYVFFLVVFAGIGFIFNSKLAVAEIAIVALLLVYSITVNRRRRKDFLAYLESVAADIEAVKSDTLVNFPLPMVAFKLENTAIVWGNSFFSEIFGKKKFHFDMRISDLAPGFTSKWLTEGKLQYPEPIEAGGRRFRIYGNIIRGEGENSRGFMGISFWLDVTEYEQLREEYESSRPIVAIVLFDNLDEISKNQPERVRTRLQNAVSEKVENWCSDMGGIVCHYDKERYLVIFEQRHYQRLAGEKFSLMDSVHELVSSSGIHASVSIGVGRDGGSFEENYNFALLSTEMALSRGGDQTVIKNRFNFEFFGGRGTEIESRTKVKSRVIANALSELIKSSGQLLIMGHKYGDMDSVGGAAGLCCIARKLGRRAYIVVDERNCAAGSLLERLKAAPEYRDAVISPQEAILRADRDTLLAVVDTNRPEQAEDKNLLMACNRVVVIDHHRRAASYIQNAALTFLEPYASSACELVCELVQELVEQTDILKSEADALLAGIVMDTKNFTLRTGERTFDAAAFLNRAGADTITVKKLLQNDIDDTVARYKILQKVRGYRDNIAVAVIEEPQDRTVAAQAADEMLNITGIQASVVIYPTGSGGAIISARSIGEINVQLLLETLGGGGNKSAAGVQFENITLQDAAGRLFEAIDNYFKE